MSNQLTITTIHSYRRKSTTVLHPALPDRSYSFPGATLLRPLVIAWFNKIRERLYQNILVVLTSGNTSILRRYFAASLGVGQHVRPKSRTTGLAHGSRFFCFCGNRLIFNSSRMFRVTPSAGLVKSFFSKNKLGASECDSALRRFGMISNRNCIAVSAKKMWDMRSPEAAVPCFPDGHTAYPICGGGGHGFVHYFRPVLAFNMPQWCLILL